MIDSKFGFSKHIDKAVKQSGALVKSVIRRTNLLFCIVLLFSQSFTMALMFGVLGFMIDSKFGFSKHIDKAVKQSGALVKSVIRRTN